MWRVQGIRITLLAAIGLLALPASVSAQSVDETCALSLTRTDPATVNVAYPDEGAVYYLSAYQAAPGTRIRIQGEYPHSRYISFHVYDQAQRPLDALADVELRPDTGSVNPFVLGAQRTGAKRSYTAFVDFGPLPQQRAPNTLYTGTGQNGTPNYSGSFIYRIYVPDQGRDAAGGVPLPTVTLQATDGGPAPASACASFQKPPVAGVNEQLAASNGLPAAGSAPGYDPPRWAKFVNLPNSLAGLLLGNPYGDPARQAYGATPADQLGGNGAFLSNIHNAYLTTATNRSYGEVLETSMRAPSFPDTRPGPAAMPGGQLRYFSMCQNEAASQRFIACRTDDQSAVGRDGFVHYVVSTPAQRPANATAACGVTWIPWGPSAEGVLIYRHMLPDPAFAQAIQRIPRQGLEAQTMGDYLPVSRYFGGKSDFERLGCVDPPARQASGAPAGCRDRLPPRSTVVRASVRVTRRGATARGRSRDRGCAGLREVRVSLARVHGRHGCRFVRANGSLTPPRSCRRAVLLPARGAARWRFSLRVPLQAGVYRLVARGYDRAGNKEPPARRASALVRVR